MIVDSVARTRNCHFTATWMNPPASMTTTCASDPNPVLAPVVRPWLSVAELVVVEQIVSASVLEEAHTLAFSDALIIEAAIQAGAATLLSEDLQDGRRFGGLRVENPFRDL